MVNNNLLFLASAVLVLMVIMGQPTLYSTLKNSSEVPRQAKPTEEKQVLPRLKSDAENLNLTAKSVYVIDVETNHVLLAKNPQEPLLPASTTKIATALVALAHFNLDEVLTVGKEIELVEEQTMDLALGEEISVKNLLYGLLVFSANDAAEVLAASYPGGRENFVLAMNRLTDSSGLLGTHFTNPAGFDEYLHFSNAQDLARLASLAVQNPVLAEIVATPKIEVSSVDGKVIHKLTNINELVGKVPGVLGIKTGWTINAKESLVTLVERNGQKIIISLLGSDDRFGETEKIIDWIFANYSWE